MTNKSKFFFFALLLLALLTPRAYVNADDSNSTTGESLQDIETIMEKEPGKGISNDAKEDEPPAGLDLDSEATKAEKEAAPEAASTDERVPAVQGPNKEDATPPADDDALEKALEAEKDKSEPRETAKDAGAESSDAKSPEATLPEPPTPSKDDSQTADKSADANVNADSLPGTPPKNEVTNLEFTMEGDVSRITVSFKGKPVYEESRNTQVRQYVYLFENTETPQQFQRAYDTSEFPSPITIFTMLEMPQIKPTASKLIIQEREDKAPKVTVTANQMFIDFPAPDQKELKPIAQKEDPNPVEENIYAGGKLFKGKQIKRLEVKNSDIADVLRLIAKTSGYNIVVGDEVQGKVGTISVEDIPWDQAFTLVLQSKHLGYIRQGNVLRVGTLAAMKTEKDEALANENARIKVEPLRTLLIPISYAKAQDLAPRAKSFLSERGVTEIDQRTNTIIVKDVEKNLNRVQRIITALDTAPARVSISAKMVELSQDFTRNIGFSNISLSPTFAGINLTSGLATSVSAGSVTTISAPNFANLNANFQIGEIDQRVKTLANPQVTTVANQAANINESFAFFIQTSTSTAAGITTSFQQITTNLTLDVTPIVSGDGTILLNISFQNAVPNLTQKTIAGNTITTQVMLDDGDTAVIGGVFNDTVNTDHEGIPVLSNIPILGFFFSSNSFDDNKSEIYMFITAKILNAEETFKRTF
jgi:type IV pilus assembly protein PilQ